MADAPRPRCRLTRTMRVRKHAEFQRALKGGARANDQRLTVWLWRNGLDHSRLGLMVGRQHGNAVRRNRLKRLMREAFRLSQHELPRGCDLLCTPRSGAQLDVAGCRESLVVLANRLARREKIEHEPE